MTAQEPFTIEQFYKFLQHGKLKAAKCLQCGTIHLPPRPVCGKCLSQDFEWVTLSGEGKLASFTVIHVAPQQFEALTPYPVGIIELEEGLRIPGMINGVTQEQLKIGMELTLDFGSCSTTQHWPKWPRYCFKPKTP